MIRPLTCVCMLLAAGSGLYLYQVKHRAEMLDRQIGRTLKQTAALREQIGVLKGEWALLNEPDRLAELSSHHLGLQTLSPTQFSSLADLGGRLPAPLPPGSAPAVAPDPAVADTPMAEAAPAATPAAAPVSVVADADAPPPAPSQPAAKAAPHGPAVQVADADAGKAERAAVRKHEPRRPTRLASAGHEPDAEPSARLTAPVVSVAEPRAWTRTPRQAPQPARVQGLVATRQVPNGMSIGESVLRASRMAPPRATYAYARSEMPRAYAAPAYAAPAYAAPISSAPVLSALGGAARGTLPPPVPYGGR